jgi:hypothetical protein
MNHLGRMTGLDAGAAVQPAVGQEVDGVDFSRMGLVIASVTMVRHHPAILAILWARTPGYFCKAREHFRQIFARFLNSAGTGDTVMGYSPLCGAGKRGVLPYIGDRNIRSQAQIRQSVDKLKNLISTIVRWSCLFRKLRHLMRRTSTWISGLALNEFRAPPDTWKHFPGKVLRMCHHRQPLVLHHVPDWYCQ